jgi:hypothetical protein
VVVASVVPEVLEERPSLDNHLDQTECHILLSEHEMLVESLFTYVSQKASQENAHWDGKCFILQDREMQGRVLFSSVSLNLKPGDFTSFCTLAFNHHGTHVNKFHLSNYPTDIDKCGGNIPIKNISVARSLW